MILSLDHVFRSLKISKYKKPTILVLEFLIVVGLTLVGLYIFFHNSSKDKTANTQTSDLVKSKTYKVDGVVYKVPAKVIQISVEDLYQQVTRQENVQVIHVASASEWQQGHIPGSIFDTKENLTKYPNLSRDKAYVFVAKDQNDSIEIGGKLVDSGYLPTNVRSLKGGLSAWTAKGYKLEK